MDNKLSNSFARTLQEPDFLKENKTGEMEITDIPVLITEDGIVVCVKKREEVSSICLVGLSGNGKTLLLHSIVEGLYYLWNENVVNMNDWQSETLTWCQEQDVTNFVKISNQIGLKPTPLPMVYVFPNTSSLNLEEEPMISNLVNKNYIKASLPISELLNNLPFYFNAICPEFQLGQSTMYANEMVNDFAECEVPEDFFEIIDNKYKDESGKDIKNFRAMKAKIKTAFKAIFDENLLRITSPDAPAFISIENFTGNPLSAILYANGIPSFITSDLRNKPYKNAILAYYINSLFASQKEPVFSNRNLYMVFDELNTICSSDDREANPAKQAIINVVARGRLNRVGIIYATQVYSSIPREIKSAKMNYLFTFKTTNKIAKELVTDFGLPETRIHEIQKLKVFECIGITNDKFVCYKDGKKWESNESFKGKIIFPISKHKWT